MPETFCNSSILVVSTNTKIRFSVSPLVQCLWDRTTAYRLHSCKVHPRFSSFRHSSIKCSAANSGFGTLLSMTLRSSAVTKLNENTPSATQLFSLWLERRYLSCASMHCIAGIAGVRFYTLSHIFWELTLKSTVVVALTFSLWIGTPLTLCKCPTRLSYQHNPQPKLWYWSQLSP